ncbi:hypothetical protein [Pseudotabrizicola algicola]|uniref:Lipoprotein n=1 Tax=Pseudotabrizicola algicola TaxID=2709381 RepID=A0A6B3RRR1_9RHOB|nr:hypothetical protein [Pseudotabrizicola algicola]NEX47826.1 hypothetical protein [Pseudotabrizicola algicola]
MRKLLACLVLAGCVGPLGGAPQPQAARLSAEVLTLTLTDGTVCRVTNWTVVPEGRLDPCLPGARYAVRLVENPNFLRQIWTGLTSALGAEGAVPPMAEVEITDAAGRSQVFVSPPPVGNIFKD